MSPLFRPKTALQHNTESTAISRRDRTVCVLYLYSNSGNNTTLNCGYTPGRVFNTALAPNLQLALVRHSPTAPTLNVDRLSARCDWVPQGA